MSKQKRLWWQIGIILIYIFIALLGFGVAYVIKVTFLQSNATMSSQTTPTVTTTSEPKGWKTYTIPDYQVSFAYPQTDTVKNSSYGFGVSSVAFTDTKGDTNFQILLMPKSLAEMAGQDFNSYYTMKNNTTKVIKNPVSNDNTSEKFTKINNTTVDGLSAVNYTSLSSNTKPGTPPEIGTLIQTKDDLILISTDESNKTNLEKLLKTFQYQ